MQAWKFDVVTVVLLTALGYRLFLGIRARNAVQTISCAAVFLLILVAEFRRHFPAHEVAAIAAACGRPEVACRTFK